jgi:hypothetical protein
MILGGWLGQSHTQGVGNVLLALNDTKKYVEMEEKQ